MLSSLLLVLSSSSPPSGKYAISLSIYLSLSLSFSLFLSLISSAVGHQGQHTPPTLSFVVLYTWGIHMRESQVGVMKGAGVRVAVVAVWVYAVVLTVAYSTNLTASLTVAKAQPAVNTFR